MPEALWPPRLLPGGQEWLEAFWELGTDRQIGMKAGPIPASSIEAFADRQDMHDSERATFRQCVREMDAEWLAMQNGDDREPISDHPLTPDRFKAMFGGQRKESQ